MTFCCCGVCCTCPRTPTPPQPPSRAVWIWELWGELLAAWLRGSLRPVKPRSEPAQARGGGETALLAPSAGGSGLLPEGERYRGAGFCTGPHHGLTSHSELTGGRRPCEDRVWRLAVSPVTGMARRSHPLFCVRTALSLGTRSCAETAPFIASPQT